MLKPEFDKVFGKPVLCCGGYPYMECMANHGTAEAGDEWDLCFTPGDYLWLEDDSKTANCLIDLHHKQDSKCISVEGSSCEAIKGTSKILNAQVSYIVGDKTIDSAASLAMQGASNAMVDEKVAWGEGGGKFVTFSHRSSTNDLVLVSMTVRFEGGRQC